MENIKTKYEEKRNEEKNGVELYFEEIPTPEEREELKNNGYKWSKYNKCWYKSLDNYTAKEKKEEKELKNIIKLDAKETEEIARLKWNSEKMQKYIIDTYDYYKTKDGLILELEKVKKISIDKTMYYDDEYEAPEVTEKNFIIYNRYNIPGRNLEEYLQERERLQKEGCASGRYDYNGIYFNDYGNIQAGIGWAYEKDKYFKRYLTPEEENDYIELMKERKVQYIERLKKYFKKYGKHVTTYGYWANR